MEETSVAWLAGLFDGEGTIGFYLTRPKKHKPYYQKRICVNCGDVRIIAYAGKILADIVGRPITVIPDYRPSKLRPQVYFKLEVYQHEELIKVLSCLEPYLVGKKAEAQFLLDFLRTHKKGSRYTQDYSVLAEVLKVAKKAGFQSGNPELSGGSNVP